MYMLNFVPAVYVTHITGEPKYILLDLLGEANMSLCWPYVCVYAFCDFTF